MKAVPGILPVLVASIVGFLVPMLWFAVGMVLFGGTAPLLARVLWWSVHLTCPFWSMPGPLAPLAMPILNASLYAAICALVRMATGRSSALHTSEEIPSKAPSSRLQSLVLVRVAREPWWLAACVAVGISLSVLDGLEGTRPDLVPLTEFVPGLVIGGLILSPFVYCLVVLARLMFWALSTESVSR